MMLVNIHPGKKLANGSTAGFVIHSNSWEGAEAAPVPPPPKPTQKKRGRSVAEERPPPPKPPRYRRKGASGGAAAAAQVAELIANSRPGDVITLTDKLAPTSINVELTGLSREEALAWPAAERLPGVGLRPDGAPRVVIPVGQAQFPDEFKPSSVRAVQLRLGKLVLMVRSCHNCVAFCLALSTLE